MFGWPFPLKKEQTGQTQNKKRTQRKTREDGHNDRIKDKRKSVERAVLGLQPQLLLCPL